MTARELKALIEVGTSLGYSGDELKQFINDERMRQDREKENERAEKERVEKQKETKEKEERNYNEPNVRRILSVLNAIKSVLNVKRRELMSLKGLDLRKKSKCSEYVQSMNLRWQRCGLQIQIRIWNQMRMEGKVITVGLGHELRL